MARIISHYTLMDDKSESVVNLPRRHDHIVKVPIVENGETLIPSGEPEPAPVPESVYEPEPEPEIVVEEEISVEEEVLVPEEPKEPVLQLVRNGDGIVIGIEVLCGCGEKIIIKMEY